MKRITIATDLSARSDRAMERAVRLARAGKAELTVVHAVDRDLPAAEADAQEAAAKQTLQDQVDKLTAGNGVQIATEVVLGSGHADIVAIAEKTKADLIVLGVHRKDAFRDLFRDTTAERVLRAVQVPVLVVKDQVRDAYGNVMVGVDLSDPSRRALEFAIRFAPQGTFHLVHAYEVPFKGFLHDRDTQQEVSDRHGTQFEQMVEEDMAAFLAGLEADAPKLERVMQEGTARQVIHRQLTKLKPDLLVIGTHGRTGIAHAFLGSVAEDLLSDPPCDVLAVPPA